MTRTLRCLIVLTCVFALASCADASASTQVAVHAERVSQEQVRPNVSQLNAAVWYTMVVRWNAVVLWNETVRHNEEKQNAPPPVRHTTRTTSRSVSGACTGFVIPDYIIQRESGGNPSASNPSGAWGCAQTLISHYRSGGACAGMDPYSIQGQRDCVYVLSDGGRNLDPWAQTR